MYFSVIVHRLKEAVAVSVYVWCGDGEEENRIKYTYNPLQNSLTIDLLNFMT